MAARRFVTAWAWLQASQPPRHSTSSSRCVASSCCSAASSTARDSMSGHVAGSWWSQPRLEQLLLATLLSPCSPLFLPKQGVVIVDHSGVYKADVGVKAGMICGIGKAGNPDVRSSRSSSITRSYLSRNLESPFRKCLALWLIVASRLQVMDGVDEHLQIGVTTEVISGAISSLCHCS